MNELELQKPTLKNTEYYEFEEVWNYIKEKYNLEEDCIEDKEGEKYSFWGYLCETQEVFNGGILSFSDWEMKHENGKFMYLHPPGYWKIIGYLLEEFGVDDKECNLPGVRKVNLRESW